jgi:hypothetical protein
MNNRNLYLSRREMIETLFGGMGIIGLSSLLGTSKLEAAGGRTAGYYTGPRLPAPAKHIIMLFMAGGPSQIDMFDPKPALKKYEGQRPAAVDLRTERSTGGLLSSPFEFKRCGQSGLEFSSLVPQLGTVADEMCVIRSMYTFNPTHTPGVHLFHSGSILATRPSTGSWVTYGLGSENDNIPAFVVLNGGGGAGGGAGSHAGFLPSEFSGIGFNSGAEKAEDVIPNLRNQWVDASVQRHGLDAVQSLNKSFSDSFGPDLYLEGRIKSMETAFRMQSEAFDIVDLSKEPANVREEYGSSGFAKSCLMARRLVENGTRYVLINYGGWDDHIDLNNKLIKRCPDMDQAAAALIRDLKRRGLLDETLVVWSGEFGRTPVSESGNGRDHNPYGFTVWMAGGGIKGGMSYGATDEFGFKAVENRVSIHDLHATMLNRLGMDHTKLTYRYAGRDFRLTDVHGMVPTDILK